MEILVSDNAPNYTSKEFETFMKENGTVYMTSAPDHPASNGLAERAVQTVKSGITKTAGDNFEKKLHKFLFLFFNYRRTPSDENRKVADGSVKSEEYEIHPILQGKVHKKQTQMKETHDRKGQERKYTPVERESV